MTTVSVFLLGPPRFERDGAPVVLTMAKAVALLAYLAASDGPQPRERVLGLLWADSSDEAARKNLRNTLWTIRRTLGEHVIRTDGDRILLHEHVWIDLREFERLTRTTPAQNHFTSATERQPNRKAALALFGGELLDGLAVPDALEFELWLTTEREQLRQRVLQLLSESAEFARVARDWPALIETAQRALREDNLHEPMYRALMEGYARLGERAEALRQYDLLRNVLDQELGVEPLPETDSLRAAILDGGLSEAEPAGEVRVRTPARLPILGETQVPFVGRSAECAMLDGVLAESLGRQARIVLLGGEIGIGKSRLASEWSRQLGEMITVVSARCIAATQQLPFLPLIELFSSPLCMRTLFRANSPVPPVWLAEVARLLPELRSTIPDLPPLARVPPDEERRRVFEAFTQCLRVVSASGLVVLIDDLHWADQATLDWLSYFLRRAHDWPALVAATWRQEEAVPALLQELAAWGRDGISRRIDLPRLDASETTRLIAALGGTATPRIVDQGGGNPYYLIELYRAPSDAIPVVLADLVQARIARLPETTRQVLQAAVVLEPEWEFGLLRHTSGRTDEETLDALDSTVGAALLSEQAGRYRFAHPLIAAVLRTTTSQARQAFLHRRAAGGLEASAGARLPQLAGQLAEHCRLAGDRQAAAKYATIAADHALTLAAPAAAVAFYQQALEQEPTPARQLGLGRALERQGDLDKARSALEQAQEQFATADDQLMAAQISLDLAYTFLSSERGDEVARWVAQAQHYPVAAADPYIRAYSAFLLNASQQQSGQDLVKVEAELRAAAAFATDHKLWQLAAFNRFQHGNLLAERGDIAAAVRSFEAAVELAQIAGDPFQEVLSYNNAAYHAVLLGEIDHARDLLERGMARNEAAGLRVPLQWLWSTRGELALAQERWNEAEAWFQRGMTEANEQGNHAQAAGYQANLGRAAWGRGDYATARTFLEQAREALALQHVPHQQSQVDLWLVELYLTTGEHSLAQQRLASAEARLADGTRQQLLAWAVRLRTALR